MSSAGEYTPRAQKVLALAREEAARFNHSFVGTEHLLLGLIRLGQGTAVNALLQMGLNLETVRDEVEKQVGTGPDQKLSAPAIPCTPRVNRVLALAAKEAKRLNHTFIGTESILLGLLLEGDGVAARVLKNLDVDVEETRQCILKQLEPDWSPPPHEVKTSLQAQSQTPQVMGVDTTKRYDVYCHEGNQQVVYRNVLFRAKRRLFAKSDDDFTADFIELEQATGEPICISRSCIVKFCEHGVKPEGS